MSPPAARFRLLLPLVAFLGAFLVPAGAVRAAEPVTLKTTEFGQGPTVVLVHNLGGSRMGWMPTARKLLGGYRVVMVDLPGHGESPMPGAFSMQAGAEALAKVIARQKAESTVVVGQGVGGLLSLLALSAHPEYARGLVMIDAATRLEEKIPDQQQRYFLDFVEENYDTFLRMMFTQLGRDSAQGVALHAQAAQVPPAHMKPYLRERLNFDASAQLKSLKIPMLYVGTEKNWPADKDWTAISKERGLEGAAQIRSRRLGKSGPMVATEQPDSLALAIREFSQLAFAKKK